MGVRERPILMSAPMVKAILEGRKTQTRRVIKPQFKVLHAVYTDASIETELIFRTGDQRIHCPYGQVGDRLWGRETWRRIDNMVGGGIPRLGIRITDAIEWKAGHPNQSGKWRPSIFMPRWASRITLEITSVRVQRVQEISDADIVAEGAEDTGMILAEVTMLATNTDNLADAQRVLNRSYFCEIWDSINAKRGHSWESNPWVWVLEFARV